MKHYFNTTGEAPAKEQVFTTIAKTQTDLILDLMRRHKQLTPSEVYRLLMQDGELVLLTSVRRSMTVLMRNGKLWKTDRRKDGLYGRKESIYCLIVGR